MVVQPDRLRELLDPLGFDPVEANRLVKLMSVLDGQPPPPDPVGLYPAYEEHLERFRVAARGDNGEALEEAFLALYCHLHGHKAPYSAAERKRVKETGGYWAHAGGLSPILKAGPLIRPDTVLGDFGAGNGLQGLLMQVLDPHEKTIQIEISSRMIEAGQALQGWLGIPDERVEWIVGDVLDTSPRGMDFIYLYRPVRPVGEGRKFYERFAEELARTSHQDVRRTRGEGSASGSYGRAASAGSGTDCSEEAGADAAQGATTIRPRWVIEEERRRDAPRPPLRTAQPGEKFGLGSTRKPVVIFSVADCLREFLPVEFEVFYADGHLTCYRRE